MYKYIEIKTWEDQGVEKRINVTGKNESQIDRIERGMNINLDHDTFYTVQFDHSLELESI